VYPGEITSESERITGGNFVQGSFAKKREKEKICAEEYVRSHFELSELRIVTSPVGSPQAPLVC